MKMLEFMQYGTRYLVIVQAKKQIVIQRDNHDPITFKVGDLCEESSYNLIYTGTIKQITERNVIIAKKHSDRSRRMKLEDFAWRNWDFNADRVAQQNFETSQYI